ncbi:hypothetical protein [Pseudomonas sp. dw_612]|uniref:hypothetical protein n=1 Tax=Pseudomonas sp. dw_612 TaxID=2720080 RepID=UPI001BD55738|nr:hypothetical protein [Pseudomonas sp. dw_612]
MNIANNTVVTLGDRLERLQAYDVTPEQVFIAPRGASVNTVQLNTDVESPTRASIVGDAILAFVSGMSPQNQADIQHAYLFASLVANKKYPRDEQSKEWYQQFLQVMQDCGWNILSKYYDSVSASAKSFKVDQLALKILGSAVAAAAVPGPTSALMLKVAGDALAALQTSEQPLQVFDRNTKESGTGGVGVASCLETAQGEVIMAMGVVRFIKRANQTKVLFVDWDASSVDLYRGECQMVMVPSITARTRNTVLTKLGDRAQTKIEEYEI